jgi:hypothetical protein
MIAATLRARVERIAETVEALVEGPAETAYRRLSPPERSAVVRSWIDLLADAFDSGDLTDGLDRAESYGRGHGLAGSSAEVTLGGSLALERAMERALAEGDAPLTAEQRAEAASAMGRLTVRVATAWAGAVAGRGARHPA